MVEESDDQLVDVLEGEVHALPARRCDDVGGITRQQHPTVPHRLGDIAVELEAARLKDTSRDQLDVVGDKTALERGLERQSRGLGTRWLADTQRVPVRVEEGPSPQRAPGERPRAGQLRPAGRLTVAVGGVRLAG